MTTATFLPTEDGRFRSFALWPSAQAHLRGRWERQPWPCTVLYFYVYEACTNANQLEVTIDVPMLGTIIEQNGDGLLEQSHMPVGWPLHIDGAVRQNCAHRGTTLQELDNLLGEYDLKRDLVEINRKAPQWSHNAVWNKIYMEPGQASPYNNCGRAQSQPSHRKHPLLWGEGQWHTPGRHGPCSSARCYIVR